LRDEQLTDLDAYQLRFRLLDAYGQPVLERVVGIGPDRDALVEMPLGPDFPGAYILRQRESDAPRPAIVVLGGSEGGDGGSRSIAPDYAAEGFTVLGLPYYSPAWGKAAQFPDLPQAFADIPVDYLEEAVEALRLRDDVKADQILLHGGSKGAEFVLLAGALISDGSPGGGFCGIVADVPSDVVWEGWGAGTESGQVSSFSWRGEPLPFIPYQDMSRALDRSDPFTMTEAHVNGRVAHPDRVDAARIQVEEIDEPVLVIGGMKDTTWNSGEMSKSILQTRNLAGRETEGYVYDDAGHGVGGSPLVRTSRANLAARLDNFPATVAFMKRNAERDDCRD
ncbi:MAG: acyl-CoA thioester hydrolase/BAAT C-terminal domain-containing protein, partial [Pseudomonadota bacterium]